MAGRLVNSDETVLRVGTVARPWVLTVTGLRPGVTRVTVTDLDGRVGKIVVVVEGKVR